MTTSRKSTSRSNSPSRRRPAPDAAGLAPSIGFPPIARASARLLILGSLPGAASLARREYYAQPQNSFWPILAALLGFDPSLPYAERAERLSQHHIAVWDVCRSGIRPGSLDSAIERQSIIPNDFAAFFRAHPALRTIAFNGRTAESLFRSLVLPTLLTQPTLSISAANLRFLSLPSTSPAHASLRFADKLTRWRALLDSLEESA